MGRYVSEARATFQITKGRKRKADPDNWAHYDAWLAETCEGIISVGYAEQLRRLYEREQRYKKLQEARDGVGIETLDKMLAEAHAEETGKETSRKPKPKETNKEVEALEDEKVAKAIAQAEEARPQAPAALRQLAEGDRRPQGRGAEAQGGAQ